MSLPPPFPPPFPLSSYLKPGALLAVPPSKIAALLAALVWQPAKQIAMALHDFGGYIVDDTGSKEGGGALCMESGVNAELEMAYNVSVRIENPLTPGGQGATLYADLLLIFQALAVVTNNGPANIGGGGTPLAPLPPPICGAAGATVVPDVLPPSDEASRRRETPRSRLHTASSSRGS